MISPSGRTLVVLLKNTNLLHLLSEYHVTQGGFMVSVCSLGVERDLQEDTCVQSSKNLEVDAV